MNSGTMSLSVTVASIVLVFVFALGGVIANSRTQKRAASIHSGWTCEPGYGSRSKDCTTTLVVSIPAR